MRARPARSRTATAALLTLLLTSVASVSANAVLGIDLGQEYIKAALVKPGIPLDIVLTKDTKRKEVSAIGFKPAPRDSTGEFVYPERVYGADAVNLAARFPDNVYPNLKQLLGRYILDDAVSAYSARYPALQILPSQYRSTVAFRSSAAPPEEYSDGKFTVEELLAMQLKDIVGNAEAMAGSKIKKVVFTIPPYFTAEEKYALNLAAELAGLKVMTLVTEGLAVGINYATSRTFNESTPEYHIIYDMGAGSTTASVLKFQGITIKDVGKFNKTVQDVSVLGVGYDRTLGGDLFTSKMFDILFSEFLKSPKAQQALASEPDPKSVLRGNGKFAAKLWREAGRVRQILSANTEILASVESLYDEVDFKSGKITRAQFEEAIKEFEERITKPIVEAIENAKIPLDQIQSLIIHGGGARTPFVGRKLEQIMGGPERISKNVNSDEAAVFGATFRGAAESGSFRVKAIKTSDVSPYGVAVKYKRDDDAEKETTQPVFNAFSKANVEKIVTLPQTKDFAFHLIHTGLPPRPNDPKKKHGNELISLVQVQNLTASAEKLTTDYSCNTATVATKFGIKFDPKDLLPKITRGWIECEVEVAEKPEGVVEGVKEFLGLGKKKDSEQDVLEDKEEKKDEKDEKDKKDEKDNKAESKIVKRVEKINLQYEITKDGFPALPAEEKAALIAKIQAFENADAQRRKLEETRNELEALTYKARELLTDDAFIAAATPSEREKLESLISHASDWLYDEGYNAPLSAVSEKLAEIHAVYDPILRRREENRKRPEHIKSLEESFGYVRSLLDVMKGALELPKDEEWAGLEPEEEAVEREVKKKELEFQKKEVETLEKELGVVENWLKELKEKQAERGLTEDAVLTTAMLEEKIRGINEVVMKIVEGRTKEEKRREMWRKAAKKKLEEEKKKEEKTEEKEEKEEKKEEKHDEL
ncbi:lumenal Hsp70 protein [Rhizina undulata]